MCTFHSIPTGFIVMIHNVMEIACQKVTQSAVDSRKLKSVRSVNVNVPTF